MGFSTKAACGAALYPVVEHHSLLLVFFGLALATFDFLDGFGWLRIGFLRLRAWVYGAIHPSTRPLSVGDYWLISVLLLVGALSWSVVTSDGGGAPIRFFIYATLGLAVIVRLYLVIYAVEKTQLSRPPRRTSDRLLARISTQLTVSAAYAEPAENDKRARTGNVWRFLLVPLTYLWQTVVGIASILIWALYSPILFLTLIPFKLIGYLGVAIAAVGFFLPRLCR